MKHCGVALAAAPRRPPRLAPLRALPRASLRALRRHLAERLPARSTAAARALPVQRRSLDAALRITRRGALLGRGAALFAARRSFFAAVGAAVVAALGAAVVAAVRPAVIAPIVPTVVATILAPPIAAPPIVVAAAPVIVSAAAIVVASTSITSATAAIVVAAAAIVVAAAAIVATIVVPTATATVPAAAATVPSSAIAIAIPATRLQRLASQAVRATRKVVEAALGAGPVSRLHSAIADIALIALALLHRDPAPLDLLPIELADCVLAVALLSKLDETKARRAACHPNLAGGAKLLERFLQILLCNRIPALRTDPHAFDVQLDPRHNTQGSVCYLGTCTMKRAANSQA